MQILTKDDIPDMVPLFHALHRHHVTALSEVFHDAVTEGAFAARLAQVFDTSGAAVGVRKAGVLVGYASFMLQERPADVFRYAVRRGYLDHLYVMPAHRRLGHARAMIVAMERWLVARGATIWTASHYAANPGIAQSFAACGASPDLIRVTKSIPNVP